MSKDNVTINKGGNQEHTRGSNPQQVGGGVTGGVTPGKSRPTTGQGGGNPPPADK